MLHLHEPLAPGPGYACLVACGLPKVGTFHRAGKSIAYRLLGPLARALAGRLAARCAVSAEAEATARDALGGTYDIIGNGIDLERFVTAHPCPTAGPTVLFVGRHEERKGLGVLLEAACRLDPGTALTVWIAGRVPTPTGSGAAIRRAAGSCGWDGSTTTNWRRAWPARDVLCAPALRGESFGVVLLEAMAARAAVVASDLPGYEAVVAGHGVLVPPGDVGALARALETVAVDAADGTGSCAHRPPSTPLSPMPRSGRCPRWPPDTSRSTSGFAPALAVMVAEAPGARASRPYTSEAYGRYPVFAGLFVGPPSFRVAPTVPGLVEGRRRGWPRRRWRPRWRPRPGRRPGSGSGGGGTEAPPAEAWPGPAAVRRLERGRTRGIGEGVRRRRKSTRSGRRRRWSPVGGVEPRREPIRRATDREHLDPRPVERDRRGGGRGNRARRRPRATGNER